ncbi:AI-2E family transporter [Sorangium sp. So ce1128]
MPWAILSLEDHVVLRLNLYAMERPRHNAILRGLPPSIGALAALVVDLAILVFVGAVVTIAGVELEEKVPAYLVRMSTMTETVAHALMQRGFPVNAELLSRTLHTASLVPLLGGAAVTVASAASNLAVVLLVVFFALCELSGASAKVRGLLSDPVSGFARIDRIVRKVQKYLVVKTLTSLIAAVLAYVLLVALDVDLALLLASSLFVLHFIPNVGSVAATVPAVLVALASQGPGTAAVVAVGYVLINTLVGKVMEPRVLGRTLGLSPLAVLLGILFWGWLWGPSGALLSVPLMMVTKSALENVEGLSWIARARGARVGRLRQPRRRDPGARGARVPQGAASGDRRLAPREPHVDAAPDAAEASRRRRRGRQAPGAAPGRGVGAPPAARAATGARLVPARRARVPRDVGQASGRLAEPRAGHRSGAGDPLCVQQCTEECLSSEQPIRRRSDHIQSNRRSCSGEHIETARRRPQFLA